ncbi:N-acetylglucosamine-6-phosphate deacetylase [Paenibacillaceae bacterium WGS1546]|uniref:N-acetylglucosamine-6-phosphate deacetylase n=1 Tax=Cohnella sp. WGS1546 TaxID=3366810 RepID=UPI00372D303A
MADRAGERDAVHYATGRAVRIKWQAGKISGIEEIADRDGLPDVAPGLVDLQINGCFGIDFNSLSLRSEEILLASRKLYGQGVTSYFPTVITNAPEAIERLVGLIADAARNGGADAPDDSRAAAIAGIHLEGPFLSPQDGPRGAHNRDFIRSPDWAWFARWQEAAQGMIRLITLSPEWDEAPEFIERCVDAGVTVSIGHTAANAKQIRRAVAAGATMSTHLGNGAHAVLPRHPNYIWDQLADPRLAACAIADGFHLPESVLQVIYAAKRERMYLVSDAVDLSGLAPGRYRRHIGGDVVLTERGRLHLAGQEALLAGSVKMLKEGVVHLRKLGLCSPAEAWDMASVRPAGHLGLAAAAGLAVGAPADLVVYRGTEIQVEAVYKGGRAVWNREHDE